MLVPIKALPAHQIQPRAVTCCLLQDAKAAIEQAVKDAESSSSKLSAAWDAALALPLAQDLHAAMQVLPSHGVGCSRHRLAAS